MKLVMMVKHAKFEVQSCIQMMASCAQAEMMIDPTAIVVVSGDTAVRDELEAVVCFRFTPMTNMMQRNENDSV